MDFPLELPPDSKFGFMDNNSLTMENDPGTQFWQSSSSTIKYFVTLENMSTTLIPPSQLFTVKEKNGSTLTLHHWTLAELKSNLISFDPKSKPTIWLQSINTVVTRKPVQNIICDKRIAPLITHFTYGWIGLDHPRTTKIGPLDFINVLSIFPNLQYLAFTCSWNMDRNDTGLPSNEVSTLRKILNQPCPPLPRGSLTNLHTLVLTRPYNPILSLIKEILSKAPSLQSIYGFPYLHLSKLTPLTAFYKKSGGEKPLGELIKSYELPGDESYNDPLRANNDTMSKIYDLYHQPTLPLEKLVIFFRFEPQQYYHGYNHESIKKIFSKLLQQSAHTLITLEIQPLEFFKFLSFPQVMSKLETIKFNSKSPAPTLKNPKKRRPPSFGNVNVRLPGITTQFEADIVLDQVIKDKIEQRKLEDATPYKASFNKYFPPEFDLSTRFPMLHNVKINIPQLGQNKGPEVNGAKGRKRKVEDSETPIQIFEDYFPPTNFNKPLLTVRHLKLTSFMPMECVSRLREIYPNVTTLSLTLTPNNLNKVLPLYLGMWNELQVICLSVDLVGWNYEDGLDSAVTGMSMEKCKELRGKNLKGKELEKFKIGPSITDLKDLRLLKLKLKNVSSQVDDDSRLFSEVSVKYGFGCLNNKEFSILLEMKSHDNNPQGSVTLLKDVHDFLTVVF